MQPFRQRQRKIVAEAGISTGMVKNQRFGARGIFDLFNHECAGKLNQNRYRSNSDRQYPKRQFDSFAHDGLSALPLS